jgi:threonine/homoserine efflux transporter RhtA
LISIAFSILADFMVNMAAGWVGVAVILPIGLKEVKKQKIDWKILILDLFCGILSLIAAYLLRSHQ